MSDRLGGGYEAMVQGGLVPSRSIGKAVKAIKRWVAYGHWARSFDPTWEPLALRASRTLDAVPAIAKSEPEAKRLLRAAGVPVPQGELAHSFESAVEIANRIGWPVVLKIASADILHKSEVGGVILGVRNLDDLDVAWKRLESSADALRGSARVDGVLVERMAAASGIEVLVGVTRDPVFGPVMTFGMGGVLVELLKDVSRQVLPLTRDSALTMIGSTKCSALLSGYRSRPAGDVEALVQLLMRVSDFVASHLDVLDELELNPIWVGSRDGAQGAVVLDAVMTVKEA